MAAGELSAALGARACLHHVGVAVPDIEAALELWTGLLGARLELRATLEEQAVHAASLELPGGGALLELIAPITPGTGGVGRFIERRGAGLHHVAWAVDDVASCLERLVEQRIRLIDAVPRTGLHGTPVAFVHPSSTGGVLTELVEVDA